MLSKHPQQVDLETKLLKLIHDVSFGVSVNALQDLQVLLNRQADRETYADTAKAVVDFLFSSVRTSQPSVYASATSAILSIIPTEWRDWSRPDSGTPPRPLVGRDFFRQLILERARSYFTTSTGDTYPGRYTPSSLYTYNEGRWTLGSLEHKERLLLVEFVGELGAREILTYQVIHEYLNKLLHSIAVPTPNPSELEAVCQLVDTVGTRVQHPPNLFTALEVIRQRDDTKKLAKRLHFLLLVVTLVHR